jgi:hypothetical protein
MSRLEGWMSPAFHEFDNTLCTALSKRETHIGRSPGSVRWQHDPGKGGYERTFD